MHNQWLIQRGWVSSIWRGVHKCPDTMTIMNCQCNHAASATSIWSMPDRSTCGQAPACQLNMASAVHNMTSLSMMISGHAVGRKHVNCGHWRGILPRARASSCSKSRAPSSRMAECMYSFVIHWRMPAMWAAVSCARSKSTYLQQ